MRGALAANAARGRTGWAGDGTGTDAAPTDGAACLAIPLAKGTAPSTTPVGAADDRTFVVATGGPEPFYLLRISPGAADPARMTRLPIQFARNAGNRVDSAIRGRERARRRRRDREVAGAAGLLDGQRAAPACLVHIRVRQLF